MIVEIGNMLLLCVFLFVLVKASDYLVLYSMIIGQRLKISQFIIGVTIVAIGTSLPELVSVIYGLLTSSQGGDFVSGTIIGSNIANSLLIFGVLLFFISKPLQKLSKLDFVFLTSSTIFLFIYVYFSLSTLLLSSLGIVLFISYLLLIIFKSRIQKIISSLISSKGKNTTSTSDVELEIEEMADLEELSEEEKKYKSTSSLVISLFFLISVIFLNLSARGIVFTIDNLAELFNIPQFLLTFTTIAFATSLPELMVTIQAARKNDSKLALGNIIGSNIANILLIGGVGLSMATLFTISISTTVMTLLFFVVSLLILIVGVIIFSRTIKYSTLAGIFCIVIYILIILYNIIINI